MPHNLRHITKCQNPNCQNTCLVRLQDFAKCNQCGWTSKMTAEDVARHFPKKEAEVVIPINSAEGSLNNETTVTIDSSEVSSSGSNTADLGQGSDATGSDVVVDENAATGGSKDKAAPVSKEAKKSQGRS